MPIQISIDLNKIDKSKIKPHKNGAKYYAITVDEKQMPDQYGNTHTVYDTQSKEERSAKANKNYLGSGREYVFGGNKQAANAPQQPQNPINQTPETIDDLPF